MRISPVQLLASSIERLRIDLVGEELSEPSSDTELLDNLLVFRQCATGAGYWDADPDVDAGVKSRTFLVRLGLKTPAEGKPIFPYHFEIVASGFVTVFPERVNELSAQDAAVQFGLTMLFGTIRESLLFSTSRMAAGRFLLPTMNFLDETFDNVSPSSVQASLRLED